MRAAAAAAAPLVAVALGLGAAPAATAQTAPDTATQQQTGETAPSASGGPITAPATVDTGQLVDIVVGGAEEGARIELWGPIGSGEPGLLTEIPLIGGVAALTAPRTPGSYQLRYLDAAGNQRGQRAFDVAAVPVTLTVPTPVGPGGALEVTWQGPANPGDQFEIVSPAGTIVESIPVAGDPTGSNLSRITAPREPGAYELRYVTGQGAVLRSVGFDVR